MAGAGAGRSGAVPGGWRVPRSSHHETRRQLLTRGILVSAFALWGLVQIAPELAGNAVLNDVVIVLFVVDLAILVSPWL